MRRVGKSCLLRLLSHELLARGMPKNNLVLIDKESMDFDDLRTDRNLHAYCDRLFKKCKGAKALCIDEVQEIQDWERAIASLGGRGDIDIILTGSNAQLLSSELATKLSGRYIEFPIYSLSFSEFLEFRGKRREYSEEEFRLYVRYGGLPALHQMELCDEVAYQYLSAIYSTILLKDIVARHSIRQVPLLEKVAQFLFDNTGQIISANRIANYLKSQRIQVGVDTVLNYLGYFQEALVAHRTQRYDIKGRHLLELHEKYYLNDIGLRHALLGYREADIAPLLENLVFLELKRRGYSVTIGKLGDREIDFIATKENAKIYIQVAYLLASAKTIEREFSPLADIPDNYPKLVLSMDPVFGADREGVRRVFLPEFLLGKEGELP